jgi:hypothetical protein
MIWIGAFFLKRDINIQKKSLGFALLFANMHFARMITAAFGSGDEVYVTNVHLDNYNLS